jgi:hypothetical protein
MIPKIPSIVNTFHRKKLDISIPLNIHMTSNEKDALMLYLECRLLDFACQLTLPTNAASLLDGIYDIMADLEETLETQVELSNAMAVKKNP